MHEKSLTMVFRFTFTPKVAIVTSASKILSTPTKFLRFDSDR